MTKGRMAIMRGGQVSREGTPVVKGILAGMERGGFEVGRTA